MRESPLPVIPSVSKFEWGMMGSYSVLFFEAGGCEMSNIELDELWEVFFGFLADLPGHGCVQGVGEFVEQR